MQEVSQAWKDAQKKHFVPEAFVEITMNVGDPESQADASASDNGHEDYSNSSELTSTATPAPKKFLTFEGGMWVLDGSFVALDNGQLAADQGYVGNTICDDSGLFADVIPTITISFSKVFTDLIPGVTITWSNTYEEFAKKFRITAFANGEQTYQGEFEGSDIVSIVYADIDDYDTIKVEVLEWCLPQRRARIENILVGIIKTYKKSDLMNYQHKSTVDPLSAELPDEEITFKVKNLNGEYNPDNPTGAERYLMERQTLEVRYGYSISGKKEYIAAGTFFMSEWETPQNGIEATFKARNFVEYMSDKYSGPNAGTLYDIASSAFEQSGLPKMKDETDRWYIDEKLKNIDVPDGLDLSQYTNAEVLQYVANAACCTIRQDRLGMVRIEPLADGQTDYLIGKFVSYENSEISLTKQLKAVNVNDGQYVLSVGPVGETQPIDNPLISDSQAPVVAQWAADYLVNRKILSGSYRADPRLDPLDRVINQNSFSENVVLITEIEFKFNGAFDGSYEGRAGV